jgi:hypothetical protein
MDPLSPDLGHASYKPREINHRRSRQADRPVILCRNAKKHHGIGDIPYNEQLSSDGEPLSPRTSPGLTVLSITHDLRVAAFQVKRKLCMYGTVHDLADVW